MKPQLKIAFTLLSFLVLIFAEQQQNKQQESNFLAGIASFLPSKDTILQKTKDVSASIANSLPSAEKAATMITDNLPSTEEITKTSKSIANNAAQISQQIASGIYNNLPSAKDVSDASKSVANNVAQASQQIGSKIYDNLPAAEDISKSTKDIINNIPSTANNMKNSLVQANNAISTYLSENKYEEITVIKYGAVGMDWTAAQLAQHLNIDEELAKQAVRFTVVTAGSTVAVYFIVPAVLPIIGFTEGGVAAGSTAAWVQSVFYKGYASGLFSYFQSVGALGVSAATRVGVSIMGGFTAGAVETAVEVTHDKEGDNKGYDNGGQ